jgi:hypothetical protein
MIQGQWREENSGLPEMAKMQHTGRATLRPSTLPALHAAGFCLALMWEPIFDFRMEL